jgi:hypothetical protein
MKCGILGAQGKGGKFNQTGLIVLGINSYMTVNKNEIIGYIDAFYLPNTEKDGNPVLFSFQLK